MRNIKQHSAQLLLMTLIVAATSHALGNTTELTATTETQAACQITTNASYQTSDEMVEGNPFYGVISTPKNCDNSEPKIVVVLGGSEGGVPHFVATKLASHGLTAMAVGYFGIPETSLPAYLNMVPLDAIDSALTYASERFPKGNCCALLAGSKGSEAAFAFLSLTSHPILGYVSFAGSGIAFEGLTAQGRSSGESAWTYRGHPLNYAPYAAPSPELLKEMFPEGEEKPPVLLPFYRETLKNESAIKAAMSPVEKIAGPILLVSGEDDQLWPSKKFADVIVDRLKRSDFAYFYKSISYQNAGHALLFPFALDGDPYKLRQLGGTLAGNKKASEDAWPQIFDFFGSVFKDTK